MNGFSRRLARLEADCNRLNPRTVALYMKDGSCQMVGVIEALENIFNLGVPAEVERIEGPTKNNLLTVLFEGFKAEGFYNSTEE